MTCWKNLQFLGALPPDPRNIFLLFHFCPIPCLFSCYQNKYYHRFILPFILHQEVSGVDFKFTQFWLEWFRNSCKLGKCLCSHVVLYFLLGVVAVVIESLFVFRNQLKHNDIALDSWLHFFMLSIMVQYVWLVFYISDKYCLVMLLYGSSLESSRHSNPPPPPPLHFVLSNHTSDLKIYTLKSNGYPTRCLGF